MNCTNCGNALAPGTTSCPNCGTPVVQPVVTPAPVAPAPSPAPAPVEVAPAPAPGQVQPQMMPAGMPQPSPVPVQQQPAPQPAVVGGQVPTPNKSGSKKVLIIVLIFALLAAGIGGYFVYNSIQEKKEEERREEKKKDKEKEENNQTDYDDYKNYEEEIKKNVSVKSTKKLSDGSILLLVENKSTRIAGVDVELEFYDASGTIMGTHTTYVDVAPNSERYAIVSKYSTKEGYDKFEINLSTIDYTDIMDLKHLKASDFTKNETEDEIILQYKNNTEYKMDFEVVCIFYSNNEIVYVGSDTDYVDGGSNANVEIDLYYLEDITYDRYELFGYAEFDTYGG